MMREREREREREIERERERERESDCMLAYELMIIIYLFFFFFHFVIYNISNTIFNIVRLFKQLNCYLNNCVRYSARACHVT